MRFQNDDEMLDACAFWQNILRLNDWTIYPSIVPGQDIGLNEAQCSVNIPRKILNIQIAREIASGNGEQDDIASLVHELLHAHFQPFTPKNRKSLKYDMWEQAVDQLSLAFVNLYRELAYDPAEDEVSTEAEPE